jgi:hypothetical protein
MYVRFRGIRHRLSLDLVKTRREGAKVKAEYIGSLGSVALPEPIELNERVRFWRELKDRFRALANRVPPMIGARRSPPFTSVSRSQTRRRRGRRGKRRATAICAGGEATSRRPRSRSGGIGTSRGQSTNTSRSGPGWRRERGPRSRRRRRRALILRAGTGGADAGGHAAHMV